jgi:hypothetical protein
MKRYTTLSNETRIERLTRRVYISSIEHCVYETDERRSHRIFRADLTTAAESLFRGIREIVSPDAQDSHVYPLLGDDDLRDPRLRQVYSWKSPVHGREYKIFAVSPVETWGNPEWRMIGLTLTDDGYETPDTDDGWAEDNDAHP